MRSYATQPVGGARRLNGATPKYQHPEELMVYLEGVMWGFVGSFGPLGWATVDVVFVFVFGHPPCYA